MNLFEKYIIWAELGIIIGARLGYIIFYDPNTIYYLSNPWQIFNPFTDGIFVGISGMSYHGALIGFILATIIFSKINSISFWLLSDIVAISVPLAYIFGRIANFMNQELIGKVSNVPWAIYINGTLRHPSQLYEAILEGLFVFLILNYYSKYNKYVGQISNGLS